MCSEVDHVGMLKRREDWDHKLHELFLSDNEMDYVSNTILYGISH